MVFFFLNIYPPENLPELNKITLRIAESGTSCFKRTNNQSNIIKDLILQMKECHDAKVHRSISKQFISNHVKSYVYGRPNGLSTCWQGLKKQNISRR